MTEPAVLLADVGGTHARFALRSPDGARELIAGRRATAGFASVDAALADVLGDGHFTLQRAAIAWAGPVAAGRAQLTNGSGWSLDAADFADRHGLKESLLLNDFVAQVHAVPALRADQRRSICGPTDFDRQAPFAVVGPGTGLGVGVMSAHQNGQALAGEGGHVSLSAANAFEAQVIQAAREILGDAEAHVSAERLVSGGSLWLLHQALAQVRGEAVPAERLSGEAIARQALAGDPLAQETVGQMSDFLATVCSNLALSVGASGGIWLCGDLLNRWQQHGLFDADRFARRFTAKGRFSAYCAACPVFMVTAPDPAFLGLSAMLGLPAQGCAGEPAHHLDARGVMRTPRTRRG